MVGSLFSHAMAAEHAVAAHTVEAAAHVIEMGAQHAHHAYQASAHSVGAGAHRLQHACAEAQHGLHQVRRGSIVGMRPSPPPSPSEPPLSIASSSTPEKGLSQAPHLERGDSLEDAIVRAVLVQAVTVIVQAMDRLALRRREARRHAGLRAMRHEKHDKHDNHAPKCSEWEVFQVRETLIRLRCKYS
jgi:hypothetical protein